MSEPLGSEGAFERNGSFAVRAIGRVRTPYDTRAPYQAPVEAPGDFWVEVEPEYADGLADLDSFSHIFLLTYLHVSGRRLALRVQPPWAGGRTVGLFASRSPTRPNPIGLTVVRLEAVEGRFLRTGPMDLFDGTPVLDIKPFVPAVDCPRDASSGWLEEVDGAAEHLLLHIRGIPHTH